MKFKSLVLPAAIALALASCSSSKTTLPYFTDLSETSAGQLPPMDYLVRLQPEDELQITVNSEVPGATEIYNLPLFNPVDRDYRVFYLFGYFFGEIFFQLLYCQALYMDCSEHRKVDVAFGVDNICLAGGLF